MMRQGGGLFRPSHWIYLLVYSLILMLGLTVSFVSFPECEIGIAVGGSLIAAGVAGCVLFLQVWLSQGEKERMDDILKSGVERIFPARSISIRGEYDQRLNRAAEAIDIMGFGLNHLREDHASNFGAWAERVPVRILIIDPDFPTKDVSISDLRDKEEGDK